MAQTALDSFLADLANQIAEQQEELEDAQEELLEAQDARPGFFDRLLPSGGDHAFHIEMAQEKVRASTRALNQLRKERDELSALGARIRSIGAFQEVSERLHDTCRQYVTLLPNTNHLVSMVLTAVMGSEVVSIGVEIELLLDRGRELLPNFLREAQTSSQATLTAAIHRWRRDLGVITQTLKPYVDQFGVGQLQAMTEPVTAYQRLLEDVIFELEALSRRVNDEVGSNDKWRDDIREKVSQLASVFTTEDGMRQAGEGLKPQYPPKMHPVIDDEVELVIDSLAPNRSRTSR